MGLLGILAMLILSPIVGGFLHGLLVTSAPWLFIGPAGLLLGFSPLSNFLWVVIGFSLQWVIVKGVRDTA